MVAARAAEVTEAVEEGARAVAADWARRDHNPPRLDS